MGLPGMVVSGISIVVGAVMYWAITAQNSATVQNHGFRLSTVGVILMIAGVVGFLTSLAIGTQSHVGPRDHRHGREHDLAPRAAALTTARGLRPFE